MEKAFGHDKLIGSPVQKRFLNQSKSIKNLAFEKRIPSCKATYRSHSVRAAIPNSAFQIPHSKFRIPHFAATPLIEHKVYIEAQRDISSALAHIESQSDH